MLSLKFALRSLALAVAAATLTACHNGGSLTLEPGAVKVAAQGSPFVQVNEGGKALVTASTGVHGWVTIQAITSSHLSGAGGTNLILNRSQSVQK